MEGLVGPDVDADVDGAVGPAATTETVGAGTPVVEEAGTAVVIPLSPMDSVGPVGSVTVVIAPLAIDSVEATGGEVVTVTG